MSSSISPAFIPVFPWEALADRPFLIFPLLPLCCFPFARHGTPPSPPRARITSLSKLYFHIHLLLPLLPPPIGPRLTGPPSPRFSMNSSFLRLLLSPPDFPLKPGSINTSHASPSSSPPTPPPNVLPTARSPGGPPCFPSSERNSTLPRGRPAPPTSTLTIQPPTSQRRATSRLSKPPRQITGGLS